VEVQDEVRKEKKKKKSRTMEEDENQSEVVDHDDSEAEMYTPKRRKSGERSKILKKKSKLPRTSTIDL
jgi:ribosome biogenesis protein NSA1